ncbi:hypothetical protein GHT06_014381 [Daphnia sinensis]|uniref:Uncharacterized protein n=1 Tax=Daphnia sinensis TaxID=1820382 RepID=A0AAD5KVJ9_9CRUS|nr:hypothetical protein GHT06_014381 [Daphnia sinensis]
MNPFSFIKLTGSLFCAAVPPSAIHYLNLYSQTNGTYSTGRFIINNNIIVFVHLNLGLYKLQKKIRQIH